MDLKTLKTSNIINNFINAGLCIGSLVCFGFNPIALCFCFIASDIFLTIFDQIACNILIKKNVKNEKSKELMTLIEDYYMVYNDSSEVKRTYDKLKEEYKKYENEKAEQIKRKIKEEEQKKEEEYNKMIKRVKGLDIILDIINDFCVFYDDFIQKSDGIKGLKKLHKEFLRLKNNLEIKPEACFMVNFSFNTYTKELISLISSYDSIPKNFKEEYKLKYEEMINEFLIYMDNINNKIESYSVADAKLGLETLIDVLKDINKEKGA